MVIFQQIQKYLAVLGIKSNESSQTFKAIYPFNGRNSLIIGIFGVSCVSSTLHLFDELSFDEYIISVYETSTAIVNTILLVILVWKTTKIFELIELISSTVQMSKCKC